MLKQLHLTRIKHVSRTTDHFVFFVNSAIYTTNTQLDGEQLIYQSPSRIYNVTACDSYVAFSVDSTIYVISIEDGKQISNFQSNNGKGITKLLFQRSQQQGQSKHEYLISCGSDSSVVQISISATHNTVEQTLYVGDKIVNAWFIGQYLIVALPELLKFYDVSDLTRSKVQHSTKNPLTSVSFDGELWYFGTENGEISIIQIEE